jgi:hypothetical protein
MKFINILSSVISEQKRFKFDPETYTKLLALTDKLWANRNKEYDKKTEVDHFQFKTSDGTDALVRIYINPRYRHFGELDTRPKGSRDPMDLVIQLNPKLYGSKKNLFLTLYHEMLHATDPSQSTKFNNKYQSTYNEKSDKDYWGHKIEFRAITNEFLEGLVNEFAKRSNRLKNLDNKKHLLKSLNNILNYFGKGEKLSNLSLDILSRLNDENVSDNRISDLLGNITLDYPASTDLMKTNKEEPYYINYIEQIKKYNPEIWPRFLTMLYNTKEEIENVINKKGV